MGDNDQSLDTALSDASVPGHRSKVSIRPLTAAKAFAQLSQSQKLYAHHLSRASWASAKIIHKQVSPESPSIFDFILELYHASQNDWNDLIDDSPSDIANLEKFQIYAALFLYNQGNYHGRGDNKFVPGVPAEFLERLASKASSKAKALLDESIELMLSPLPRILGYPGNKSQSGYYVGNSPLSQNEVQEVDTILCKNGIHPENTRLFKQADGCIRVLQACTNPEPPRMIGEISSGIQLMVEKGDHHEALRSVSESVTRARVHAENDAQKETLDAMLRFFSSGEVSDFKEAQTVWLKDRSPVVELIIGFVEPYRDPAGGRAEFESIVALTDKNASIHLQELVNQSQDFIAELPWVKYFNDQKGTGPFESDRFEPPDFIAVHALAYCSTHIFLGINLPNYREIRDLVGFKNLIIANRNQPPDLDLIDLAIEAPFVDASEAMEYLKGRHHAQNTRVALHELLGHGTGNTLLKENDDGSFTFDEKNPPTNPLTGLPTKTYYKKLETPSSVFGKLASTLSECRADCVGLYLMTSGPVMSIFGFDDNSELNADDITYFAYLGIALNGLSALSVYDPDSKSWGQAHDQGFFAILQVMLAAEGFVRLTADHEAKKLTVHMDRTKVHDVGKKAVEKLLLELTMWLSTADFEAAKSQYGYLTSVNQDWLRIRDIVKAQPSKPHIFVQGNTFLSDTGEVEYREYEETLMGVIKSWGERFPRE